VSGHDPELLAYVLSVTAKGVLVFHDHDEEFFPWSLHRAWARMILWLKDFTITLTEKASGYLPLTFCSIVGIVVTTVVLTVHMVLT